MDFATALQMTHCELISGPFIPLSELRRIREKDAADEARIVCSATDVLSNGRKSIADWKVDVVNLMGYWMYRDHAIDFACQWLRDVEAFEAMLVARAWRGPEPEDLAEVIDDFRRHFPDAIEAMLGADEVDAVEDNADYSDDERDRDQRMVRDLAAAA